MTYRILLLVCLLAGFVYGGPVAVVNPSFECDVLAAPAPGGPPTNFTGFGAGCGWVNDSGHAVGSWRPIHGGQGGVGGDQGASQFPDTTNIGLPFSPTYANGVPDGFNYGFIDYGIIHQLLTDNIQAGFTYTLQVYIGVRWDHSDLPGYDEYWGNPQFLIELGASNTSNPNVLDRTALVRQRVYRGSPDSAFDSLPAVGTTDLDNGYDGQWRQLTLSYTAQAGDPNIGKQLVIALGSAYHQAAFDAITLDATGPTGAPEPASFAFLLSGLAVVGYKLRRK